MLRTLGYADTRALLGGFEQWKKEGRPVVTAPK
jgi:3-mercaptopyruvate sulfurtransferase SseA